MNRIRYIVSNVSVLNLGTGERGKKQTWPVLSRFSHKRP
jgi:hypothetical protein